MTEIDGLLGEPHWEINEDGRKSYHSGYFDKECLKCKKFFFVANHLAEAFEYCPICTLDIRHENESKKDNSTSK